MDNKTQQRYVLCSLPTIRPPCHYNLTVIFKAVHYHTHTYAHTLVFITVHRHTHTHTLIFAPGAKVRSVPARARQPAFRAVHKRTHTPTHLRP
jgi:hypothetical protein